MSRGEVGAAQTVQDGTVTSLRNVSIEGETQLGQVGGGVAGGFLGNQIGRGSGRVAGAVAGSVLGSVIGGQAQKAATNRQGIEIEVRLDGSGKLISVVQEANPREPFAVGDRVRVISGGGARTRVAH